MIPNKPDGKNITHEKQQRLKRPEEITIYKLSKIVTTIKGFPTTVHTLIYMDSHVTGVNRREVQSSAARLIRK